MFCLAIVHISTVEFCTYIIEHRVWQGFANQGSRRIVNKPNIGDKRIHGCTYIRHRYHAQAVHGELHLVGAAVEVDLRIALVDLDVVGGDVGGFGGGIHGFADVAVQGQVDDFDVGGSLGVQAVGDLVALEGDVDLDAAALGLILVDVFRGQAGLGIDLMHHEGEVVQQRVFRGVLLVAGLLVQGVHVGVIVIALGAVGQRGDAELGIVGHVAGAAHADDGLDIAVLILIDALGELLFVAHGQGGVRGEQRGLLPGGVGPDAVVLAVHEAVQLGFAQQGVDIVEAVDLGGHILALLQRHVDVLGNGGHLALQVVAGRPGDVHAGVIGLDGQGDVGGERQLLALEGGHGRGVRAGLARGPVERALDGLALGHDCAFFIDGEGHPLRTGGRKREVDVVAGEHLVMVGGKGRERQLLGFLVGGLFLLARLLIPGFFFGLFFGFLLLGLLVFRLLVFGGLILGLLILGLLILRLLTFGLLVLGLFIL